MQTILVIPYMTFREKLQITKEYIGKGKVQVFESYIYVEVIGC